MPSLLFYQITSEINTNPSLSYYFLKGWPFLKLFLVSSEQCTMWETSNMSRVKGVYVFGKDLFH